MRTIKITERIKGFFKTNINLKIFSLLFAFVMWFIVMSSLNPSEIKSYSSSLTINGVEDLLENDIVCLNLDELESQVVRIRIKASRPDLSSLDKNKDKLTAMIDISRFSAYYDQDLTDSFLVNVIPNLSVYSSAYEIVGYSPSSLNIKLDRLVEFTVPVRVIVLNDTSAGYVHGEPQAAVSYVTVKGPESMKNSISYAGLQIDLSDVTFDTVISETPVLFNDSGKVVDSDLFEVKGGSIDVTVGVLKEGEIAVEPPEYNGTAAVGYSVTDVIVEPDILKVVGKETSVEISPVVLPSINISGASDSIVRTFNVEELLAEKGLEAVSDEYKSVRVEIVIEEEEPTIVQIPASAISITGLGEGFELGEALSGISIEVYGNKDIISAADISGRIDLSGLSEGVHTVEVEPVLPAGTSLVDKVYIEVELKSTETFQETETEPEEAETEEVFSETETTEEESEFGG